MTFTKEQLINQAQKNIAVLRGAVERIPGASEAAVIHLRLAEITLAALTAEPVAWIIEGGKNNTPCHLSSHKEYVEAYPDRDVTPLYTAPPAPVVPDELLSAMEEVLRISDRDHDAWHKAKAGIVSCRAAMLQGAAGNSPAIQDDVRRMDWLVSKTVDVREPMVYGSHSLFWSQTITDEEDDYHATKLREQIDAAMAAENAAAPQQEVK